MTDPAIRCEAAHQARRRMPPCDVADLLAIAAIPDAERAGLAAAAERAGRKAEAAAERAMTP